MSKDDRLVHLDAYGLKVLFNHGVRRFMTGTANRVPNHTLAVALLGLQSSF